MVETVPNTGRFELSPVGPYSISASARFLEGFAPAHYEGGGSEHLRFAFVADGLDSGEQIAGTYVYPEGLDLPVYRFVNGGDAVPKLPVRGPYRHAGVEKYIDDEGRIHDGKPGGGGVRAKGGRLVRRLHPSRPSGGALRDHSPILYAVHIWNAYVGG